MTDDIRALLQQMADEVHDVRPLGRKALRRTRTRRWAIATTVVASVATLAVGGAGLAFQAGPFAGDSLTSPAGPPESTPPPPRGMPGTIVAYDRTEHGDEWWLSAYESDAGDLCVVLQYDTGDMSEDCGPYDPEGVGLTRDPPIGPPGAESSYSSNLFGWVPADTAKLWVTHGGAYVDAGPEDEEPEDEDPGAGSEDEEGAAGAGSDDGPGAAGGPDIEIEGDEEIRLFPAPDGFPFPVEFYALIPGPEDATALRIVTNDGNATVLIMSQPDARGYGEGPGGDVVAEGEHDGYPWELYAETKDGRRCIKLWWADEEFGWGEGCSTAVPDAESFQYTLLRFGGDKSDTLAFFAALSHDVASLELTLEAGDRIDVEIVEGSDVNYAVAWPPLGDDRVVRGTATARDDAGNVLDRIDLCELAGPNSMCGSDSPPS